MAWSLLAVQAYARGLTVANCGCFGVYLTQRLSWFVLAQDALMLCYAWLLLRAARKAPTASAERTVADRDPAPFPPSREKAGPEARLP
ncbi:hypothetical protein [Streptomyces sp. NPDC018833]|uniref:hypothetical protein n=1 Tax=Streptomyces sp. NPDC018833 TaxID=3365053 RepID=UPI003787A46B